MSLYEKLFRFSPTPTRTQLENFLTESLCDLLRRLAFAEKAAFEDFVCTVLLSSHPSARLIREQLQEARVRGQSKTSISTVRQFILEWEAESDQ
jgi:hypothetical protein